MDFARIAIRASAISGPCVPCAECRCGQAVRIAPYRLNLNNRVEQQAQRSPTPAAFTKRQPPAQGKPTFARHAAKTKNAREANWPAGEVSLEDCGTGWFPAAHLSIMSICHGFRCNASANLQDCNILASDALTSVHLRPAADKRAPCPPHRSRATPHRAVPATDPAPRSSVGAPRARAHCEPARSPPDRGR